MSNYYIYLFATLCACVCLLAIEADCRRLRGKPAFLSVNLGIKKVRHVVECVCCFQFVKALFFEFVGRSSIVRRLLLADTMPLCVEIFARRRVVKLQ